MEAPRILDVPVVIFSFDRPAYLEALCRGLAAQRLVRPDPANIHLMQDAVNSALTYTRYAEQSDVAACIAVFRRHFPQGQVHRPHANLGIAENILRGQRLAFEELGADLGYFFEDDLEPGPLYLHAMEALRALTEPHAAGVGYFAAYGDHTAGREGPRVDYAELGHHWGFGLRRAAWRRIQDWLLPWWKEIRRNDYPARNRVRILKLWRGKPVAMDGEGEDQATSLACADLGLARIGTDVCFARYLGEHGQHFNPHVYRHLGFDRMRVAEGEAFDFAPLPAERVRAIAETARARCVDYRANGLEPLIARLEAEQEDPDRLATAEDVALLWRLLLDRRQVPEAELERHVGRTTVKALRRGIVRSRHFRMATSV